MAKSPRKPTSPRVRSDKSGRAGASKPDVQPLDEHLAALLNPALTERGFAETPQAGFDSSIPVDADPRLAEQLGLTSAKRGRGPDLTGAEATVDSLRALLEQGDPNLRADKPWTPHRPERPDKSEGGIRFEIEPDGDLARRQRTIGPLVVHLDAHEEKHCPNRVHHGTFDNTAGTLIINKEQQ